MGCYVCLNGVPIPYDVCPGCGRDGRKPGPRPSSPHVATLRALRGKRVHTHGAEYMVHSVDEMNALLAGAEAIERVQSLERDILSAQDRIAFLEGAMTTVIDRLGKLDTLVAPLLPKK